MTSAISGNAASTIQQTSQQTTLDDAGGTDTVDSTSTQDTSSTGSTSASLGSGYSFLDELPDLVEGMQTNIIDVMVKALDTYRSYMDDMTGLRNVVAHAIQQVDGDADHLQIDGGAISDAITMIVQKYDPGNAIYTSTATGAAGRAEAADWCTRLGLDPDKSIRHGADGTSEICVNLESVRNIQQAVLNGKVSTFQHSAMIATLDANSQTCTSEVQVVGENYGRQYSTLTSLVQLVSQAASELQRALAAAW